MGINQNPLQIVWLIGILVVQIYGNVEVIVDIGLNLTIPDCDAPAQVPWVGPLPICNLNANGSVISECFLQIVKDVQKSWSYNGGGIPTLGIPNMDPYSVEEMTFHGSSPSLKFDANCTNIKITGFNSLTNLQFSIDTAANTLSFSWNFPSVRYAGDYSARGTYCPLPLIAIPIKGHGPFWLQMENLTMFGTNNLTTKIVNGTEVLWVENVTTDFIINDYAFEFIGFGGPLSPIINSIAYVFRGRILSSLKPGMAATLDELVKTTTNDFLTTQPYLADLVW